MKRIGKLLQESLFYEVVVTDRHGKVLQRISAPSKSYCKAWNQMVYALNRHSGTYIKDITGTNRWISYASTCLRAYSLAGELYGILVGKGSTPVTIDDYRLESPCGQGTGTDQFEHQATYHTNPAVVGSDCSFTIRRTLINNSGATISGIREIGCYIVLDWSPRYYGLGYRDVLPAPADIPDGGAITVTYTIKVAA